MGDLSLQKYKLNFELVELSYLMTMGHGLVLEECVHNYVVYNELGVGYQGQPPHYTAHWANFGGHMYLISSHKVSEKSSFILSSMT